MALQRFFIALVPPEELQAVVQGIKGHFAEHYGSHKAFNSPPHITLQPPFDWPNDDVDELTDGIRRFAANRERVAIALRNFGAFPPRVIYVDVLQTQALMALQQAISALMDSHYGVTDRRYPHFCPHMTVAFRDLTKSAFNQAWPKFQAKSFTADFTACRITLLRHNAQWQIYQHYPLGPADQAAYCP